MFIFIQPLYVIQIDVAHQYVSLVGFFILATITAQMELSGISYNPDSL